MGQIFFYPFMPLALLFFLVLRLGRPGAAVLPPVVVLASVWHTMLGDGPFTQGTFTTSLGPLFVVQTYDLVAVAGAWPFAAVLAERQAAIAALEESRRGLETRVRDAPRPWPSNGIRRRRSWARSRMAWFSSTLTYV